MATAAADDAVSAVGGEGLQELTTMSGGESEGVELRDGASPRQNGPKEAAEASGFGPWRRTRRRNGNSERRSEGGVEEETKGEEKEEEKEEKGEEDAASSATGSATGAEQEQEQDRGGEQEQKLGSDEEEEDEPFPAPEPIPSQRSPSDPAEIGTSEQRLVEANLRVETGGRRPKATIQVEEDELLMRAVLSHEKQLTDENTPRRPVWASIAAACGGRFASGASASGKVLWLTRVWRDRRHDQHERLSEAMKTMIKQYLEFMGEDDSPRAIPKRKVKLPFTDPVWKRRARLREQQRQQERSQQDGTESQDADAGHEDARDEATVSVGNEDDEEEKEKEEENDGDDSGVGVEPEAEPAPHTGTVLGRKVLNAAEEEKLLEDALKYIPAFAATKQKGAVWDEFARDSNGRYATGGSARLHFMWLFKVRDDASEREHAKMTPKLREMLGQLQPVCFSERSQAQRRQREAEAAVKTPGKSAKSATSAAGKQTKKRRQQKVEFVGDNDPDEPLPLPVSRSKLTLDSKLEEKLLIPIMKHIPAFEAAEYKSKVWDDAARESKGPYKTGASVRVHCLYLLRVMKDPSEREHAKITPKIREMLAEIERVGFRTRVASKATVAEPTQASRNPQKRPRVTEAVPEKQRETEPQQQASTPKGARKSSCRDVDPETDGSLMKMLLKHRPFDAEPFNERPTVWKALMKELNDSRLATSNAASARGYWLRTVLSNPAHEQHKNFSPKLRKLVIEYMEALEKSPYNAKAKKQSVNTVRSGDEDEVNSDAASSVSEPVTRSRRREREVSAASSEPMRKRARRVNASPTEATREGRREEEAATAVATNALPTPFEDHVLLLEILRDPPFLAKKKGGCNPKWELVSQAVQKRVGSNAVLATGEACMRRMVKLLSAVRNPSGKTSVTVPDDQFEMLSLVNTLTEFKATWASIEKKETELYRSLQEQIAAVLSKPVPKPQARQKPLDPVLATAASTVTEELPEEAEEVSEADDLEEEVEGVEAEDALIRNQVTQVQREDEPEERPIESSFSLEHPTVMELLRQQEPVPLGENCSIAARLKALEASVATCRAEIAVQGSRLEKGRRHHRQELLAMFELIKQEHETRTNETAEMLERIEKERLERRAEFASMISLVSQVLPPL